MQNYMLRSAVCVSLLSLALTASLATAADPTPLSQAHAHNDYEHDRPLLDALDHGFCGVEADIHLVEGALLVAHDSDQTRADRTLESLYLAPLRERVRNNGGRVYPNGPTVILLIDLKTEAAATYLTLKPLLAGYKDILTEFQPGKTLTNAVTVILSGNRPRDLLAAESSRYAAMDGRIPDLKSDASPQLIPLVSDNWNNHFPWRGDGNMSTEDQTRLKAMVQAAHAQGRIIRFWAIPDQPSAWKLMQDAGVDLINTDNLSGLRDFLTSKGN
ncbi:MAG: hypothetical protein RI897_483 [Verrucomicrobiota bacterium]|jgi:glycerophosphoryl diester phosphodiesterase